MIVSHARPSSPRRAQFLIVGFALALIFAGFSALAPNAEAASGQSTLSVNSGSAATTVTVSGTCPVGYDTSHILSSDVGGYVEWAFTGTWRYTASAASLFGTTAGNVGVRAWCFGADSLNAVQPALVVTVSAGGDWCASSGCTGGPVTGDDATLFGSSAWVDPGESWVHAIQRTNDEFGGIKVFRWFDRGPMIWSQSNASKVLPTSVPRIYSFKLNPADVISGSQDNTIRAWANSVPSEQLVYWSYIHEPEDNVARGEFTAAQWRAAFTRIITLVQGRPNLVATPILMAWTLDSRSGRNMADWTVPGAQVLGWDTYSHLQVAQSANFSNARSMPWLVAEYGDGDVQNRVVSDAEYLSYMKADDAAWDAAPRPLAVALFHATVGGNYLLDDRPASAAWWTDRIDR